MANQGYLQITRLCNQNCRFCSNPERDQTLSAEQARSAIDEFISRGYGHTILTGGEPTLHELLPEFISYATSLAMPVKLITNAQKLADEKYIRTLTNAGLADITISIYSSRPETHDFLAGSPGSFANIQKALDNLRQLPVNVTIATVINSYNASSLDEIPAWITTDYNNIRHFVWNNIDPRQNRASENPDTIPALTGLELSLHKACRILESKNITFRIERVPLCYMAEYSHASTEARKIVKGEERLTYFLDEKGRILQTECAYQKAPCCKACSLSQICPGLHSGGEHFDLEELHALFVDPQPVIDRIKQY